MIACRSCQTRNRDDARKCSKCDAPLEYTDDLGLAANPTELVGKILNGKYQVLSVLGEGGMGVVYKVRHLILEKRNLFALKILHPRFSGDERFRKRFMREVEVAMDLMHENIVQIREFGLTEDHLLFFTMDYFEGATLSDHIRKQGRFGPLRVIRIAKALLLALEEAHGNNVVHRDLKPDNILIHPTTGGDKVRILDFGIAKLLEGDAQSDITAGGIIGTPKYIAPEQAAGDPVDSRADIYSLGVVLYEMVTGKVPFSRGTVRSILLAQMTAAPPPFEKTAPGLSVPPRLESFIFDLLSKEPEKRPASARECIDLLAGVSGPGNDARAKRNEAPVVHSTARERRSPFRLRLLAVALLLLLGALAVWQASRQGYFDGGPMGVIGGEAHAATGERSDSDFDRDPRIPTEAEAGSKGRGPPRSSGKLFQCLTCGKTYEDGEMLFNRCCADLMMEIERN